MIGRFSCGYEQGAKYVNPNITMIKKIVSSNGNDAWNNPSRGGELAKGAFDEGADIIFAAAGATGKGVYQAASDAKKLAIGVDQNQNGLFKGTMLTSMVKSVDVAVHGAFKALRVNLKRVKCRLVWRKTVWIGRWMKTTAHW